MKRYGHLYEKVYDIENLKLAHKNASSGKGWYSEVQSFNKNPEEWLKLLQGMLQNRTYETSEYTVFQRKDGRKTRTIYKLPYFPDRICQWALMQVIEPILINNFVRDTYSAIPGRGIHIALNRLQSAVKSDPEGTKYCLKMDVKKFYPSINHRILKRKFRKLFKDEGILWLLDEIIDSTPEEDGIPIGNYLSQYCGNFYLSEFDHWIKETEFVFKGKVVKVKYYYRYMDDVVILSDDKEFLHWLMKKILDYMDENLDLTVKNSWQVFPIKDRGIDFIGYRVFPKFVLLRKDTTKTFKRVMRGMKKRFDSGEPCTYHDFCSVNSYIGWLEPCDSYRLARKYIWPVIPYIVSYYHNNIANQEKEESRRMKQFLATESALKKPPFWSDEIYVYALLKQEEITIQHGEDEEVPGYRADYVQYTKEEWNNLITQDLRAKTLSELDQSLDAVRANKIIESKEKLEQYYKDHPLFSTVHKPEGEYYSVTSDKQNYLSLMIALCRQAEELGVQFTPTWNSTGESCEPWTKTELNQLSLEIAGFVYPAVSKQQEYEKIIKGLTSVQEIQELEIDYAKDVPSA